MNKGYVGYSMSIRASEAYDNGEMPYSKWNKSMILDYIDHYSKIHEIKFDTEKLKKVKKDVLKKHILSYSSWHHTSSYYNNTDFYMIDDSVIDELTNDRIKEWESDDQKPINKTTVLKKGDIYYLEWSGSRKHPKAIEMCIRDANIEEKGCFYIITNDSGKQILKKKIGSNGTRVVFK